MNRLYFFNPENDINLSYGHDTPRLSPLVNALRRDGSLLPLWYSNKGDQILSYDNDKPWIDKIATDFGIEPSLYTSGTELEATPWGWSIQTGRYLRSLGLKTPSDIDIDHWRNLSHRRATIYLAQHLCLDENLIPTETSDLSEIQHFIDIHGDAYIKAPWSSSGRGILHTSALGRNDIAFIKSIIKRQGSVMLEPAHEGIQDFAMLFYSADGHITHMGYSLFSTASGGSYSGNFVGSDNEILQRLAMLGADINMLRQTSIDLEKALSDYIGDSYTGWLGVDMLLLKNGRFIPCIELNLRMTMGVVAWIFAQKWLVPGKSGFFYVGSNKTHGTGRQYTTENNRLESGTLFLTPTTPTSHFTFSITVD